MTYDDERQVHREEDRAGGQRHRPDATVETLDVTAAGPPAPLRQTLELLPELDDDVEYEYVEQCGCGGHVTRAHVQ